MRAILFATLLACAAPAAAQPTGDAVILQCQNELASAYVRISDADFRILPASQTERASGWGDNLCAVQGATCALTREAHQFNYSADGIAQTYDWNSGRWQFLTETDGATGACAQAADPLADHAE